MMNLDLVPQIFYDLIARVIPGFVLVVAWYLTVQGPDKGVRQMTALLSNQNIANFWSLTVLVVLSYILGFILRELWSLTFKRMRRKRTARKLRRYRQMAIAQYNKAGACFGKPELGFEAKDLPATHTMLDDVRRRSPSEGHRLLKLRAEAHLCEALFAGSVLLPLLNILFWYRDSRLLMWDRAALELLVVVALIALWRASNRLEKFHTSGTYGAWLSLCFPVSPERQAGEKKDGSD
jgi:hypothetical protein